MKSDRTLSFDELLSIFANEADRYALFRDHPRLRKDALQKLHEIYQAIEIAEEEEANNFLEEGRTTNHQDTDFSPLDRLALENAYLEQLKQKQTERQETYDDIFASLDDDDEPSNANLDALIPTYKLYLKKRKRYRKRRQDYLNSLPPARDENEETQRAWVKKLFALATFVTITKEVVLGLDDVPSSLPSDSFAQVGPFLLGGAGIFVFSMAMKESLGELMEAYEEYYDENKSLNDKQRTELTMTMRTNSVKLALSTAGLMLCGFLLVGETLEVLNAVPVLGNFTETVQHAILPTLTLSSSLTIGMPALLAAIACLECTVAWYQFGCAYQEEQRVEQKVTHKLEKITNNLRYLNETSDELRREKAIVFDKLHDKAGNPDALNEYHQAIKALERDQADLDKEYFNLNVKRNKLIQRKETAHKNRLDAERKAGFASTKLILSAIILTFFVLGVTAGLGVVTMGGAPAAALMAFAFTAALVATFEVVDKVVFDGQLSAGIRQFAIDKTKAVKNGISHACKSVYSFFSGTKKADSPNVTTTPTSTDTSTVKYFKAMSSATSENTVVTEETKKGVTKPHPLAKHKKDANIRSKHTFGTSQHEKRPADPDHLSHSGHVRELGYRGS
jgi:hypothetical protein